MTDENIQPDKVSSGALEKIHSSIFKILDKNIEDEVVMRPNCKFCIHPARKQAEEQFERNNRLGYTTVEKIFRNYESQNPEYPVISFKTITNHLKYHYVQQEKQIRLKEYSQHLREWMTYHATQDQKFEVMKNALEMKFHDIASMDMEPSKQAETMTKISKAIIEVTEIQGKLRGDIDSTSLVKDKIKSVWISIISSQPNPIIKQELMKSLEMFQEELQTVNGHP